MWVKTYSSENPILQLAFEEIAEEINESPDFAFISISPRYPQEDVPHCIDRIFGFKNYVAFNAIDAFKNDTVVENGVAMALFWFDGKASVETFTVENMFNRDYRELSKEVIDWLLKNENELNIFIADFVRGEFPIFFELLSDALEGKRVNRGVCGGIIATTVGEEREPGFIFVNGEVIEDGFAIASFKEVDYAIALSTGIFKRGPIYEITSGSNFEIFELDGKPAGMLPRKILKGVPEDRRLLWYTPLAILNDDGEILALRTFKDFSASHVEVWAPIRKGQKLKLAIVIPEDIIADVKTTAKRLKKSFPYVEAVLNFSCVARQYTLEELAVEEIRAYGRYMNAPVFGFFTHGEIAPPPIDGKLRLHNQTSVVIAMKERT